MQPVADRPAPAPPPLPAGLAAPAEGAPRPSSLPAGWQRAALAGVLLLSAALNLYQLDRQGFGNQYYAAAVLSMLQGWHTFFFASFDPGGFVTVDKPPLGFWVQALSAKLLGFSGVSLLLPEALAGVGAVALLHHLVRRAFGAPAGLLAALALAVTPISVATARNNTIDSLLVLALLLGAWSLLRAAETGRLRWLLGAAALIGLGFEIKMLEAYLVLPALCAVYLLTAPHRLRTRLAQLSLAAAVLLVVSLAWPIAVDLTPADQRPYVGSTQNNSELSLAFGYNGLERLLGPRFARDGQGPAGAGLPDPPGGGGGFVFVGPGGAGETGAPGPLRLLTPQLAGQVSWLLPLAALGVAVAGWAAWRRRVADRRAQGVLLWGSWLLTTAAFFSVAGQFHRYYLVTLAPAAAALAGIGLVGAWRLYWSRSRAGWLALPLALAGTAIVQAIILASFPTWAARVDPPLLGGTLAAAALLAHLRRRGPRDRSDRAPAVRATVVGVAALLVAPSVWAGASSVEPAGFVGLPSAGPSDARGDLPPGELPPGGGPMVWGAFGWPERAAAGPGLVAFLEANRGSARYLLGTSNATLAAPIILRTGQPVMALGGFIGRDPILSADGLAQRVREGEVRYFLLMSAIGGGPGFNFPGGGGMGGAWIQAHCAAVPPDAWGGATQAEEQPPGPRLRIQEQLYDCAGAA